MLNLTDTIIQMREADILNPTDIIIANRKANMITNKRS